MATLGDLRDELRNQILGETGTGFFTDAILLAMLEDASIEIAGAFRFPHKKETVATTAGDTSFALSETPRDIEKVAFANLPVDRGDWDDVLAERLQAAGFPVAYHYDPREGGATIHYGPATAANGNFEVRYVGPVYAAAVTSATNVWDGLFPNFQNLVLLRAAVKAFEMDSVGSDAPPALAGYWYQRYLASLGEFASFLGMQVPESLKEK